MELGIIKNDVVQKLRADRYFNELEITRMIDADVDHKFRIDKIASLTLKNAHINEGLRLLDVYFPSQPLPQSEPQSEHSVG